MCSALQRNSQNFETTSTVQSSYIDLSSNSNNYILKRKTLQSPLSANPTIML